MKGFELAGIVKPIGKREDDLMPKLRRAAPVLLGTWLALLAAACGSCTADEPADAGFQPPSHQGFDQVDEHGALRVSYLSDPNLGHDFDGRYIVYSSRAARMFLVDLETEREDRIFPRHMVQYSDTYPRRSFPTFAGKRIISRGRDAEELDLLLHVCTVTDWESEVLDVPTYRPNYMDSSGHLLVYNDQRYWDTLGGQNIEVFLYDFDTGVETRLTEKLMQQFTPKVSGDYVVWEDYGKGYEREEIALYHIPSGEIRMLTDDDVRQMAPEIDGNHVVWSDLRNGQASPGGGYRNLDIYLYRIDTGELRRISDEEHEQKYPTIHGRWIAWTDTRHATDYSPSGIPDTTTIYVYDLETEQEKRVTFGEGFHECCPKIHGDTLIYYSFGTGGWGSLWMVDLKRHFPDEE